MSDNAPLFYDVFISHSHADKPWASDLADQLVGQKYNGRPLRPWLDRQFLDPGDLATDAELTCALDRSAALSVVLSPATLGSDWVEFELDYFLKNRANMDVTLLLIEDCELPEKYHNFQLLDFRSGSDFDARFDELVTVLCPPSELGIDGVHDRIDTAVVECVQSDPGGLAPDISEDRDNVFRALQQFDIDDPASEGLAIAAYERAAHHLLDLHRGRDARAYNIKMLLGECMAAALVASARYREVAQRYLEIAESQKNVPVLLFVIARAFSKLAEIDADLVDTSILLRLSTQLDAAKVISNEQKAVETLVGRIVGKLRGTPRGDLLIKMLIEAGRSSRISAILGISLSYHRGGPVFYLSELERIHEERDAEEELHREPPSKRMLALLYASDLDQHKDVTAALRTAKQDIEHDFPGTDFPYGYSWLGLRPEIPIEESYLGPFLGTVARTAIDNMEKIGGKLNKVSTVPCFTEPRIVEALFQNCGALLVPTQDADSHQCQRLRNRGVPFAMVDDKTMSILQDGDVVALIDGKLRIWSREYEPDWPIPVKRKRRKKKEKPKPAKLGKIEGGMKLMQEKIQPRLKAMAEFVEAPMSLGLRLDSEGCESMRWQVQFEPGNVTIEEKSPFGINVALHIDVDKCDALLAQELSEDNIMHGVWGDAAYFSKLFDAWNAALKNT